MDTSQNKPDYFSYIRGRKVHALFTIKSAISPNTIKGFIKTTKSINKELRKRKIPLSLAFFVLPEVDDLGEPQGYDTFYVSYNGDIDGELISTMYLEYSHRILGAEFIL